MSGLRAGFGDLEARATVGAGALTALLALVSLALWYVMTPLVEGWVGPGGLTAALLVTGVVPRLVIGGVVARRSVGRGVSGGGALASCFVGAAAAAAVLPGALSVYAILAVPTTTQTWVTLAANVVVTGLTVAGGGALALQPGRRHPAGPPAPWALSRGDLR